MVPDLPLFLPGLNYSLTHSIMGLFTACLPLGLVAFAIFESLLKQPLLALLPPAYTLPSAQVSWHWRNSPATAIPLILMALLVGSATHVFWDSFTHAGQWGVQQVPALTQGPLIFGVPLTGYKLLQYGSSVLGLPILAIAFARSLTKVDAHDRGLDPLHPGVRLWVGLLLGAIPIAISAIAFQESPTLHQAVFLSLTRSMTAMVGTIVAYAVLYRVGVLTRRGEYD